jgi:hypothetical protein
MLAAHSIADRIGEAPLSPCAVPELFAHGVSWRSVSVADDRRHTVYRAVQEDLAELAKRRPEMP